MAAALLVLLVAACGGGSKQSTTTPTLTDLKSVNQLKTLFNEHGDHPQLILLVSPT